MLQKRTLVLRGAFAGKDAILAGVEFKQGKAVVEGSEQEVSGLLMYLRKCYQAHPEGESDGERDLEKGPGSGSTNPDAGSVQQDGRGPPKEGATGSDGSAGAKGGSSRVHPIGDGHSDTGMAKRGKGQK